MPKNQSIPAGAHALSQNPNDPLYRRCADSLCAHCSEAIGDLPFRLAFSEVHATDNVVHDKCFAAFTKADEEDETQESGWGG